MMFDGEIALVPGAGNGIGRAIAIALAREGARVALVDINTEKGEAARVEADGEAMAQRRRSHARSSCSRSGSSTRPRAAGPEA